MRGPLRAAWATRAREAWGEGFPRNDGAPPDRKRRRGDCAIINTFLDMRAATDGEEHDTVRGCFLEGGPIYEDSGIYRLAHIQLAVRNPACVVGYFRPTMGVDDANEA